MSSCQTQQGEVFAICKDHLSNVYSQFIKCVTHYTLYAIAKDDKTNAAHFVAWMDAVSNAQVSISVRMTGCHVFVGVSHQHAQ